MNPIYPVPTCGDRKPNSYNSFKFKTKPKKGFKQILIKELERGSK